jgi:hypothetical protein
MDHPRPGDQDLLHLLAQLAKIGGEDRRRDPHALEQLARGLSPRAHIACSIESPQLLHFKIAVEDILTIVECSPQLGQTEVNSKRRKQ